MAKYIYIYPDTAFASGVAEDKLKDEINNNEIITTHCSDVRQSGTDYEIEFLAQPDQAEKTELDGGLTQEEMEAPEEGSVLYLHDGTPYESLANEVTISNAKNSPEGNLIVVSDKSYQRKSSIIVSPNYADVHTWWHGSIRHSDVEISAIGGTDGKQYQIPNLTESSKLINIYKITEGENSFTGYSPDNYRVIVKKDDVDITEYEYGYEAGYDSSPGNDGYQIDYSTGIISFDNDKSTNTIEVSYSRSDKGTFRVLAPEGFKTYIHHIELQFTVPHNTWTNPMEFVGGINHAGTGNQDYEALVKRYRGMIDILNQANLGTEVPLCDTFTKNIYQVPFDYVSGYTILPIGTAFDPVSTYNTVNYIELRMKYDIPFDSSMELASATFYCIQEPL